MTIYAISSLRTHSDDDAIRGGATSEGDDVQRARAVHLQRLITRVAEQRGPASLSVRQSRGRELHYITHKS